jgi:hypothetical protein
MAQEGDPPFRARGCALGRAAPGRDAADDVEGGALGGRDGRAAAAMPGVAVPARTSALTVGPSVAPRCRQSGGYLWPTRAPFLGATPCDARAARRLDAPPPPRVGGAVPRGTAVLRQARWAHCLARAVGVPAPNVSTDI